MEGVHKLYVPFLQDDSSYQEMFDTTINHAESFIQDNSTLMKSLDEIRESLMNFLSTAVSNSSVLSNWNQTLRETFKSL